MEKEILSIADAANLLSLTESEVERLLASGELPGRRVGPHWFLSRQRLLQFISGEDQGATPGPPARTSQDPAGSLPERVLAPNWRCTTCGEHHGPDVAECTTCGAARNTPLMGYRLPRANRVSGIPATRKVN